jgi:hypothetical protein
LRLGSALRLRAGCILGTAGFDAAAVRQYRSDRIAKILAVLGPVALNGDFAADRQTGFGDAFLFQAERGAEFEAPVLDAAIRLLSVQIQPAMGIDQFQLGDYAFLLYRLLGIEFC